MHPTAELPLLAEVKVSLSFYMPSLSMLVQHRLLLDLSPPPLVDATRPRVLFVATSVSLRRGLCLIQALRISVWEKGILAVLTARFKLLNKGTNNRLNEAILLFKPDTVLPLAQRTGRAQVDWQTEDPLFQPRWNICRWRHFGTGRVGEIWGDFSNSGTRSSRSL